MKSILKLKLYGYTVRGIDRRDNAGFEDHIVVSDLDVTSPCDHFTHIMNLYNMRGFQVDRADIIPDDKPGYDPEKGIAIDLDLHQLYLEQLKALKEQQNESIASSERK